MPLELCGCYDIVIRRLGTGLRETFGECGFIKSAQQVKRADQALKCMWGSIPTAISDLKPVLESLLSLVEDTKETPEFETLENAIRRLSRQGPHCLTSVRVEEMKVPWDLVLCVACALVPAIKGHREAYVLSAEREMSTVRALMDGLKRKCNNMEHKTRDAELHMGKSDTKLREAETSLVESREKCQMLVTSHQDMMQSMSTLTLTEKTKWQEKCEHVTKQLYILNEERENTQLQHRGMQQDHKRIQDELRQQLKTMEDRDHLHSRHERQMLVVNEVNVTLTNDLATALGQVEDTKDKLACQQTITSRLEQKISQFETEEAGLFETISALNNDMAKATKDLVTHENESRSLKQLFGVDGD